MEYEIAMLRARKQDLKDELLEYYGWVYGLQGGGKGGGSSSEIEIQTR
jgi:hypothetical protein